MKVPILNRVVIVPVEPRTMDERIFGLSHGFSIYLIYTRVQEYRSGQHGNDPVSHGRLTVPLSFLGLRAIVRITAFRRA